MSGISRSRVAFNAVASTSRDTKKCGTLVQLCVVRSAMMRPMDVTGPPAAGWGGRAAAGRVDGAGRVAAAGGVDAAEDVGEAEAAFRMSSARTSPPGPDPFSFAM